MLQKYIMLVDETETAAAEVKSIPKTFPEKPVSRGLSFHEKKSLVPKPALAPLRDIKVLSADLSVKDVKDLALKGSGVIKYVPVMPLKLIRPVAKTLVTTAATKKKLWGIEASGAEKSPYTGKGVVCAVLDTGIDNTSPAFKGIKLIENDFTGEGKLDTNGHGTHCAGSFFGRNMNGQRIGVASGVEKALIGKVLGEDGGDTDIIIKAIEWAAAQGAHIISMSLGIDFPGYIDELVNKHELPASIAGSRGLHDYRRTIDVFESFFDLLQARQRNNSLQPLLVVAAAGNESLRDDNDEYVINTSPPALVEGIISVAALGKTGTKFQTASFSNTGATICGPGVDIISAKTGGGLTSMDGTSMAAPYVAGCAALWAEKLMKEESLTADFLSACLKANAAKSKITNWNQQDHGVGLVQAPME